jgi:hypothetical protein
MLGAESTVYAQLKEPPVKGTKPPVTPIEEGVHNYLGGGVLLDNFGIGIKAVYGHVVGPYTEITFSPGITGIRYASQQKVFNLRFTAFGFTSTKSIVNKYNRVIGFPFLFGVKQRIFPRAVSDNFRFFIAVSGGPALALVFPYLNDKDGNGYRTISAFTGPLGNTGYEFTERKEGFFKALGKAKGKWGADGAIKIGIDFGKKFKTQPTLSIGYFFYYFSQGLQIMDPSRPAFDQNGNPIPGKSVPFYGKKKYFGTPQITFTFSGWW